MIDTLAAILISVVALMVIATCICATIFAVYVITLHLSKLTKVIMNNPWIFYVYGVLALLAFFAIMN